MLGVNQNGLPLGAYTADLYSLLIKVASGNTKSCYIWHLRPSKPIKKRFLGTDEVIHIISLDSLSDVV